MTTDSGKMRVSHDAQQHGVDVEFLSRPAVSSLEEAAQELGISPREIVKTLVAKAKKTQSTQDATFIIALVPGDRQVSWAKLRKLAGMKKMSMTAPEEAYAATGYFPGTITPFGAASQETGERWKIYADSSIDGTIYLGAGEKDLNLRTDAAALFSAYKVTLGDICTDELSQPL